MSIQSMSTSRKVLLSLVAVLLIFLLLEYLILYRIILPGFVSLQTDTAIKDAERCEHAIKAELSHLKTLAVDWSAWDETYEFVRGNNDKFKQSTLADELYTAGTFDMLYVFDNEGGVIYGKIFDPINNKFITLQQFDDSNFSRNHWLIQHKKIDASITGLIHTDAGLMMISSNPVITSEFRGPIQGTLVMGRFLNSEILSRISEQTNVNFEITPASLPKISEKCSFVKINDEKYVLHGCNSGPIKVSHALKCLNNLNITLTSFTPDEVISKGKAMTKLSMLFGICISTISLISVYLLLNGILLKRVRRICKFVKEITETGNLSVRTNFTGDGDLNMLGRNINNMLAALEANEEQVTRARIEAEKANQTKNLFLANMSHEIRTPMNAIIGFSDLLSEEDLQQNQKEYLNAIQNSGQNLLNLINDILDFSKIEAGKLNISLGHHSIRKIVSEVSSSMTSLAQKKALDFKVSIDQNIDDNIYTDHYRLEQCLINLVGNAIKFTEKGHVHLNITSQDRAGWTYARFEVEDTGIGISPEKQEVIFNSFTQEDASSTRVYGGTGLGLAITRQLADILGGEIKMTSEKGKGSVFTLMIPIGLDQSSQIFHEIASSQSPVALIDNHDAPRKFTGSILVAEDTKSNQILIELLLKKFGLDVTIVENGSQALEAASSQQFDLILMDIHMPVMNGYDATRNIRKSGIKTPIIALTANVMVGDREKCFAAGCCDYLPKPIDAYQLASIVEKFLSKRSIEATV